MAHLIDKAAVVAEIERRKRQNLLNEGAFEEDIDILSFLNTIEVKEEQGKPVSDELEKVVEEIVDPTVLNAYGVKDIANRLRRTMIESVSKELEEACKQLAENARKHKAETSSPFFSQTDYRQGVVDGVQWQKEHLWKPADGEDLPELERDVIVLTQPYPLEGSEYAVSFGHRPNPDGWDRKSITTGEIKHYTPETYDKGGWNIPDIKWWLDIDLPKEK